LSKKILVLSFYYKPDLCAGSFRCTALVNELSKKDVSIQVVTTTPNRYKTFNAKPISHKDKLNVSVERINVPSHNSGIFDQIKSFYFYYREATKISNNNEYDLIVATSSRLFTAFLGARISRKKQIPLYLDIRDLFVDTVPNVLSSITTLIIRPFLKMIESYTFSSAKKINLVSEGFLPYFIKDYPKISLSFFTNGIDEEFIEVSGTKYDSKENNFPINILYAGNIGEGQGLHKIVPQMALILKDKVNFKIIGDGGLIQKLNFYVEKFNLDNVIVSPPVDRDVLIGEYKRADVLFLHLNDYDAFGKVLPSKLFEYAAMNKPILAGVSGYSADFIKSEIDNCEVFLPANSKDAIDKLNNLDLSIKRRSKFIEKFDRKKIMSMMAQDIYDLSS
tara:strand:+ start:107 stop:1279 length:1173 start_codon:yes stop_codon:yes gene_type:complete